MKHDFSDIGNDLNFDDLKADDVDIQVVHRIFKLAYDFGYKDGCDGVYVCPSSSLTSLGPTN